MGKLTGAILFSSSFIFHVCEYNALNWQIQVLKKKSSWHFEKKDHIFQ